jgi:hypothetical protein
MAPSGVAPKRWERGRPTWSLPARQAVVLIVGGGVLVLVLLTVVRVAGGPFALTGGSDAVGQPAPGSGEEALAATPTDRTGLAFLALDDPLERAEDILGPADERAPDMYASTRHIWALPDGATFEVIADEQGVLGLYAHAPVGTTARLHAYGGVQLGASTPEDVVAAWGEGYDLPLHDSEDYVLRYIVCQGAFPVVVKFDQDGAAPDVRWDEPVTSVFVAYADAEPGTAGCPAT